jgi:hypothetical protein
MRFMHVEEAVQLMKMEYSETPSLALTHWQAQQLWNLSEELCDRALRLLVSSAFLMRTADGVCPPRSPFLRLGPNGDGDSTRVGQPNRLTDLAECWLERVRIAIGADRQVVEKSPVR